MAPTLPPSQLYLIRDTVIFETDSPMLRTLTNYFPNPILKVISLVLEIRTSINLYFSATIFSSEIQRRGLSTIAPDNATLQIHAIAPPAELSSHLVRFLVPQFFPRPLVQSKQAGISYISIFEHSR
jgi:hypothetical protein